MLVVSAADEIRPHLGFFSSIGKFELGYMALFPITIFEVFGIQAYASVNSFVYFVRGCGAAFGPPVGGQILGESRGLETTEDGVLSS